ILLRRRKAEENEHDSNPTKGQQPRPACAIRWSVIQPKRCRAVYAPGKQPHQMQEPEPEAWHSIVVAGIAQIQEPQEMLINEVEPEKSMVLAWTAVYREIEIRRVPQHCQYVPWDGDRSHNGEYTDRTHPPQRIPNP